MKVAVLAGGRSPEREVSLRSGHRVATALGSIGHEAELIDPGESSLAETLAERAPDVCYLTLHGKDGEDGTVQRLLELLGIPYTGTGPYDCEIAFDKVLAKDALRRAGVATPAWAVVEDRALRDLGAGSALAAVVDRVGLPCVVKPSRSGSAMGVGFVERASDLPAAVMAALSFSGAAVVETTVTGSEWRSASSGTRGRRFHSWRSCRRAVCTTTLQGIPPAPRILRPGPREPGGGGRVHGRRHDRGAGAGAAGRTRVDAIVDADGDPAPSRSTSRRG